MGEVTQLRLQGIYAILKNTIVFTGERNVRVLITSILFYKQ